VDSLEHLWEQTPNLGTSLMLLLGPKGTVHSYWLALLLSAAHTLVFCKLWLVLVGTILLPATAPFFRGSLQFTSAQQL